MRVPKFRFPLLSAFRPSILCLDTNGNPLNQALGILQLMVNLGTTMPSRLVAIYTMTLDMIPPLRFIRKHAYRLQAGDQLKLFPAWRVRGIAFYCGR
jgi:hypothetical protein